jgi:hypothetical protein
MASNLDRFHSFIIEIRKRNSKRTRFAELMAVIFALLLWKTTWLALRPGLVILLIGQVALVFVLIYRNLRLSQDLKRGSDTPRGDVLAWFDQEQAFTMRSTLLENGIRMLGLIVLAYGFWKMTGNLWIALAIGVVYPASSYYGMMRRTSISASQYLRKRKDEITWDL